MNSLVKSKTVAIAVGMIGVVMMSLASASAAPVRDHRTKPVVRDHRAAKPEVRDHRGEDTTGGVIVTNSESKRR